MIPVYRLDLSSTAGAKFAEITDFDWLSCTLAVNQANFLSTQFRGDHAALASLTDKCLVDLYWRDPDMGIAWQRVFNGFYHAQHREKEPTNIFQMKVPGDLSRLSWRIVGWRSAVANRSKFTAVKAETIMKTLVSYNAGASATVANGRLREGAITGISVEADGAHGNTLDWYCAQDPLLETLQKLALLGGGDFDLVKTAAAAWEFRWYTGQLGTDRSATVKFGVELGNMGKPIYEYDHLDEATVAIVGGQGDEADRDFVVRTGLDYAVSNDIEVFVNATDVDQGVTAGLNAKGDKRLAELRAKEVFPFKILQTPACAWGKHYFLGDLVKINNPFTSVSSTQKVKLVILGLDGKGNKTIDVEVGTP